jgi:hypothetical protein
MRLLRACGVGRFQWPDTNDPWHSSSGSMTEEGRPVNRGKLAWFQRGAVGLCPGRRGAAPLRAQRSAAGRTCRWGASQATESWPRRAAVVGSGAVHSRSAAFSASGSRMRAARGSTSKPDTNRSRVHDQPSEYANLLKSARLLNCGNPRNLCPLSTCGGSHYRSACEIMLSGIRTATTLPRAQRTPAAETVMSTMTFRGLTSRIWPRASSGTPSGVGRK